MKLIGFLIAYAVIGIAFTTWAFFDKVDGDVAIPVGFMWPLAAIILLCIGFGEVMRRYRNDINELKKDLQ